MKFFWLVFVLAFPLASRAQGIQSAACVGDPSYPVRAIYLHGLFPVNGAKDPDDFAGMEFENRKALARIAQQLKIRIAIPLAPHVKKNRRWECAFGIHRQPLKAKPLPKARSKVTPPKPADSPR